MSIGKKYNHVSPFIFKASKDFKYHSLKDLYKQNGPDQVYTVLSLFISNGRYGKQPVATTPTFHINLPGHMLNDVENMMMDAEAVDQINSAMAGFKIRTYTNRNGGESYSVEWLDIKADDVKLPF